MNDLVHAIQFFQAVFTILLALAFGEAFKQFVPDGDDDIRWDRFPSLTAFLVMIFPFYHGMTRYLYDTYLVRAGGGLKPVAGFIMFDGIMFMGMSAMFFVMSRSLSPSHWVRFFGALSLLLLIDTGWIVVCLYRGIHLQPWLWLNALLAGFLFFVWWNYRTPHAYSKNHPAPAAPSKLCAIATIITTTFDYTLMHQFYFP